MGGHDYGKLCPENVGNEGLMAEGEGKLASTTFTKRDDRDFALWKPVNQENLLGRRRGGLAGPAGTLNVAR